MPNPGILLAEDGSGKEIYMSGQLKVGVVGAGMISNIYLENMIGRFDNLKVIAVAARHRESAERQAGKYGISAYTTEELIALPEIDMVVNLTPVEAHYGIIKAALEAGKHVYTEKAMTDDPDTARELLKLADEKGLYLGSAPDTFLGASLQTARKAIDDGLIGEVTSCVASANRNNDYLLSYAPFLKQKGAGVCMDYGVYYLTAMVSLLGPVAETASFVRAPYKQHIGILPDKPDYGKIIETDNESEVSAILRFASGVTGTFHLNADSNLIDQADFRIYGTKGILLLGDPNQFGGAVRLIPQTSDWSYAAPAEVLEPVSQYTYNCRGIGPSEMADAILSGRQPRASKELAMHVLELADAILKCGEDHIYRKIQSTCKRPEAF